LFISSKFFVMVLDCGWLSALWVGGLQKSRGNIREFYIAWRVVTLTVSTTKYCYYYVMDIMQDSLH